MARILAWCDSPTAPTGFGRSAKHILGAFHDAGHVITQLAVNHDPATSEQIPWEVVMPNGPDDPYGLGVLSQLMQERGAEFNVLWSTFDPQVPWGYMLPGAKVNGKECTVLEGVAGLKQAHGLRAMLWAPIDGGPLSDFEMSVLGGPTFDHVASMAEHVYDVIDWTVQLKGQKADMAKVREKVHVIPHGIDTDVYKPLSDEERAEVRRAMGVADKFVIVQVERNQQRKEPYRAYAVLEAMFKRWPKLRGQVVLYQHMQPDEENAGSRMGWNLPEIPWRYGLEAGTDVQWPPGWVGEADMARIVYGIADVFLSVSTGEGFQYPVWEALACGVACVVPDDSARRAWLSKAPGVTLYKVHERETIHRGGYFRRMGRPDAAAAGHLIGNLATTRRLQTTEKQRRRRHAWVKGTCPLERPVKAYTEVLDELLREQAEWRRGAGMHAAGNRYLYVVDMMENPGLGDVMMAAPAVAALQQKGDVLWRLPAGERCALGRALEVAAAVDPANVSEVAPDGARYDLSKLWHPQHAPDWASGTVPRAHVIADHCGLDPHELEPLTMPVPPSVQLQAHQHFQQTYGVDVTACVAIALESAVPARNFPREVVYQLADRVVAEGLTPILIGRNPLQCQRVGWIDLTGKISDVATLIGLLHAVGSAICTDSFPLHAALSCGTPTVGVFPILPGATRTATYDCEVVTVEPPEQAIGEDTWPPGPLTAHAQAGSWVRTITAEAIWKAFEELHEFDTEPLPDNVVRL